VQWAAAAYSGQVGQKYLPRQHHTASPKIPLQLQTTPLLLLLPLLLDAAI
jgi:hypothetical protein